MKLLIDTCTLLWWRGQTQSLSEKVRALAGTGATFLISAVTGYEIAIKSNIGKLKLNMPAWSLFERAMSLSHVAHLPLTLEHAVVGGDLPLYHKDPFDRLLAAQAIVEGVPLVTPDRIFIKYGVETFW